MLDLRGLGVCTVSVLLGTAVAASCLLPGVLYAGDSTLALEGMNASAFAKLQSDYSNNVAYDPFYVGDQQRQALAEAIKAKTLNRSSHSDSHGWSVARWTPKDISTWRWRSMHSVGIAKPFVISIRSTA